MFPPLLVQFYAAWLRGRIFRSGDDAFVVQLSNFPLGETKDIQQDFVGVLTKPRRRLCSAAAGSWEPG